MKNISIFLFTAGIFTTFGQTSINSAGGNISNVSGTISYSIGQVSCQNIANVSGAMSSGVQQTFIISALSLEKNILNLTLSAFPNPTHEQLTLRVGNYTNEKLDFSLIDNQGKILEKGKILSQETKLDLNQLPEGTYFININDEDKKIKSFKIVKNQ